MDEPMMENTAHSAASPAPCIVWDWNGTLLDDVDAAVSALNRMLARRNVPPTTRDAYRARFRFPVRPYYAELGVDLEHEDWDSICEDFHRFIGEEPQRLRAGARDALAAVHAAGMRQYVLSALREDLLRRDVSAAGIDGFFDAVFGVDNLDGATKLSRGHELMRLPELSMAAAGGRVLMIGDTLHDAEVASAIGARCILLTCGHQTPDRLAAAGVPLAPSPAAAAELALRTFGRP